MKKSIPFFILFISTQLLIAQKPVGEEVKLLGVENPQSFTISPDGLRMIVVDYPKKGPSQMKKLYRPYLESTWGAANPVETINRKITEKTIIDAPCFDHLGTRFFFAANFDNSLGGLDIYQCSFQEGECGEPVNIGVPVNSKENENSPSISGNNRELFFTRPKPIKRLEEYATQELWMSEPDSTSTVWLNPKKINTIINSNGLSTVKMAADNQTILYSLIIDDKEKWQLYWAKRLGDIHWYLPQPIDTLNSKMSECCPVYCPTDGYLYFIRNRGNEKRPDYTMYRFTMEEKYKPDKTISLSGRALKTKNEEPVCANILITDPVLGRIKYFTRSESKLGNWSILLNAGETFMFHAWQEGFSHFYQLFTPPKTDESFRYSFALFDTVTLSLNIYDKEELWPLQGEVTVFNKQGNQVETLSHSPYPGKVEMTLPIGSDYTLSVAMKDYIANELELALSNIVLYDRFVRDIELIPMKRTVNIIITDSETGIPLTATIVLINQEREYLITPEPLTGVTGHYSAILREGEAFRVEVRGPRGYAFKSLSFDLNADRELQQIDIALNPLKIKVPIRLNNINFEFNSSDLLENSYEELDRVWQLLIDNPDIKAEIMAHTDDVGSDQFNNVLAQKRAQSVTNHLVTKGIDGSRLISTGFGESMPLVPNDSEENRALNRRVELKILDLYNQEINEIEKENIPE